MTVPSPPHTRKRLGERHGKWEREANVTRGLGRHKYWSPPPKTTTTTIINNKPSFIIHHHRGNTCKAKPRPQSSRKQLWSHQFHSANVESNLLRFLTPCKSPEEKASNMQPNSTKQVNLKRPNKNRGIFQGAFRSKIAEDFPMKGSNEATLWRTHFRSKQTGKSTLIKQAFKWYVVYKNARLHTLPFIFLNVSTISICMHYTVCILKFLRFVENSAEGCLDRKLGIHLIHETSPHLQGCQVTVIIRWKDHHGMIRMVS